MIVELQLSANPPSWQNPTNSESSSTLVHRVLLDSQKDAMSIQEIQKQPLNGEHTN